MKKITLLLCSLFLINNLFAQEKEEKKISVELHGFVGVEAFYVDKASTVSREGSVYLWPSAGDKDGAMTDISAAHSRIGAHITGPDAFGATSKAVIEGDFAGTSGNGADNVLRLRHAYINLSWDKASLTVGQTWHPFFLAENFPGTVKFDCGLPVHPLSRDPQIKFGYKLNEKIEVLAYLVSQSAFRDVAPANSLEYSKTPEMDAQVKYTSNGLFAAATFGYKTLQPNPADDKQVKSIRMNLSLRNKFDAFTVKAEGIYGGAMSDLVMIGGYGVNESGDYVAINTAAAWLDFHTNSKKIQPGLAIGYTQNMGTSENANFEAGRGSNINTADDPLKNDIADLLFIMPRVNFFGGSKAVFGLEYQFTSVNFGHITNGTDLIPTDTENVTGGRILASLKYNF